MWQSMSWVARLRRATARWLAALSRRVDVPDETDSQAAVARLAALMSLVEAGRIRRRSGESTEDFSRRLIRGDFVLVERVIDFERARGRLRRTARNERTA